MGATTGIQWTDATFNPWWGCTKVSPGCDHCYAETQAHRFGTQWGPGNARRTFGDAHWREPINWNAKAARDGRRIKVFCASMADVFDNEAPAAERQRLFELMEATPWLDWQLLTKRIGNVLGMVPTSWLQSWPTHVHMGATIVNQPEADRDIIKLLRIPASVRFLSIEPMLGAVDLARVRGEPHSKPFSVIDNKSPQGWVRCVTHAPGHCLGNCSGRLPALSWVIAGGESGTHARPAHPDWFRSLRDQCAEARVPFFFKQWGEWLPNNQEHVMPYVGPMLNPDRVHWLWPDGRHEEVGGGSIRDGDGSVMVNRIGKKTAGRLLDGIEHNGFPEVRS